MIEIALVGVFLGSLFQDHKWRVDEWSGWYPAFKFIGFWTGYVAEYGDIFFFLWTMTAANIAFEASVNTSIILFSLYSTVIPLLLLHIYNPEVRWGWCYLHSALLHFFYRRFINHAPPYTAYCTWLENNMNTTRLYEVAPRVNLLYIPLVLSVYATLDKTHFVEDTMFMNGPCSWIYCSGILSLVLLLWQLNYIAVYKPDLPVPPDVNPVVRIAKGYTLMYRDFLKWHFFRMHRMPWKFFNFMRVYGIYELCPHTRTWQPRYCDVAVLPRLRRSTRLLGCVQKSDTNFWPSTKPMPQRGTYRNKTWCDSVYATAEPFD